MNLTIPTLETERLILRGPVVDDFDSYADIFASPRSSYMGGPYSRDRAWQEFAADNIGWILHGFGYWTVTDKETDSYIGAVGMANPPSYPERELGWMLHPNCEGKGYAREAAIAARNHAYKGWSWSTVVSYVDPENARSIRLAERLGCAVDTDAKAPDAGDLVYRHPSPEALI